MHKRDEDTAPRKGSPPAQAGGVVTPVVAPKVGATKPAAPKAGKPYNPIHRLGAYAHPPKGKKK
jgi:hypothetical protein